MLRYDDINDISDGKLYDSEDLVKAGTNGCQGCSRCCESDMGNTIELTPYDMYNLIRGTGESLDELLSEFKIELSMIDGIILPNLKMDKGCSFLKGGRCEIHEFRPGICRLFPLGRLYNKDGFDYFLQKNECALDEALRTDVRVSEWIGIRDLEANTQFINKWHKFLKFERKKIGTIREMASNEVKRLQEIDEDSLKTLAHIMNEDEQYGELGASEYRKRRINDTIESSETKIKEVMKTVIRLLYLDKYDIDRDFYQQFDERLRKCLAEIRRK